MAYKIMNLKFIGLIVLLLFITGAVYGSVWYWQSQQVGTNIFCGGIAGKQCPEGYSCKFEGNYPDAGGTCIKSSSTGTLTGHVSIGPNCPVEREGVSCTPSPEAYVSRELIVLDGNGKEVARFHADANGNYSISLLPGTYTVVSAKTGLGSMSKDLPATVIIKVGQSTTLNIDIDTGIR